MSDEVRDKVKVYEGKAIYTGRWWAIIGIIVALIYPLFYIFAPYTNHELISVNGFSPVAFLKETVMAFILFPLSFIMSFAFCFLR